MKKKLGILILAGAIIPTTVFAQNTKLIIDNKEIITSNGPINDKGSILVPLRVISSELGAGVKFDNEKQEITVTKESKVLKLRIGEKEALVDGKEVKLTVPAKILNGATYVPIRFISEQLDSTAVWEHKNNKVIITSKSNDGNNNTVIIDKSISSREDSVDNKNIYTPQFLKELVDNTPCSEEVKKFRASINPRRNGLLKEEGKYFDIYYPNTEYAKEQLEIVKPHMDKAYMMLTDLYGIQAKVEVHFIDGEVGRSTMGQEGEIRNKENVTFVWLEPDTNDKNNGNIREIIHEMNHNFFAQVNSKSSNKRWMEEAVSKQVASLYTKYNYGGSKIEQWSFYDIKSEARNVGQKIEEFGLGFKDVEEYFRVPNTDGWGYTSDPKKKAIQQYALFICSYIYNTNNLDSYKQFLRNQDLKDGTTFDVIKRELGINIGEFEEQIMSYMNSYKR